MEDFSLLLWETGSVCDVATAATPPLLLFHPIGLLLPAKKCSAGDAGTVLSTFFFTPLLGVHQAFMSQLM